MRSFLFSIVGLFVAGTLTGKPLEAAKIDQSPDLVVYGGTASGVMTAYSAAREGLQVVLLEPGVHLGGMVTGGLSATDLGHYSIIGGYARDFYMKAAGHYGVHDLDRPENWRSEPHVDEEIFRGMLQDTGVVVHFHERLREHDGVELHGKQVVALITGDGKRWPAKVFADCSYEGDLMAEAKVSYTWGRESSAEYGEDLAGVREHTPKHQFLWPLSAYDDHHRLLPEIDPGPLAAPGSGDKKVQAYNFRLILTNDPVDRLPFPRPQGYDRSRFALLERYLKEFPEHMGRPPGFRDLTNPVMIPDHKADFNNNGPVSTDYIGHSWKYPEGSYAEKAELWKEHLLYTESFFYFLSQDASVPESLRAEVNQWGLPKDEFADTDHWPNQLYIREGRRMLGEYVMRQSDLQTDRTKPDSIGMGSYNSDSHNIQRVAMPDGTVQNEGDVQVPVEPYEISYRSILPRRRETVNLLVPVCLSASHAAYSSVRMEPQYMIIGQAAGVAAALAVQEKRDVLDVPVAELQQRLRAHGAILHLSEEFQGVGR
ncbi:MAG TPA: FAD-dependent oxidoreductase [Acidobacteriaceae bacterium]|nr:FAD-dependent oxidoreductase [Acidobacteriaceae bacterium]